MSLIHNGNGTDSFVKSPEELYTNRLLAKIAELEKTIDGICIAVFDNRGKAVTETTVSLVRAAVARFELPLDFKQKEQEL
jgi:hypothetical protein